MPHLRRIYALPPDLEESAIALFWMAGTLGVQSTTGPDGRVRLEAWFPLEAEPSEMLPGVELEREETVPDADWFATWRERARPFPVGRTLYLDPREPEDAPAEVPEGRRLLRLPARAAFGTGSHESTSLALELLEDAEVAGVRVLDVGTGTGKIARDLARRGAGFSAGFDIDPVAGPCLRENLDLNPAENRPAAFYVGTLDALRPAAAFDVLVINMIRTETWPYLDALLERTLPGGRLVFSGQRIEDQPHWKEWFAETGVSIEKEITLGEWWGFTGKKSER